ncbi:uncharacterized protein LOC135394683 [Ornithodoros turicata]|uniref:uncharacterized protein LOC135394683 n=1 Tax=Ornithodoros turicata TaxID=34597 RepID=UPI003138D89F
MPCGVRGCANDKTKRTRGFRMHQVPANEPARSRWLALIQREDVQPGTEVRICSLHFNVTDYESPPSVVKSVGADFRIYLKRGVAPSLNLPGASEQCKRQKMSTCTATRPAEQDDRTNMAEPIPDNVGCARSKTTPDLLERVSPDQLSSDNSATEVVVPGEKTDLASISTECIRRESSVMAATLDNNYRCTGQADAIPHDRQVPQKSVHTQTWKPVTKPIHIQTSRPKRHTKGSQASLSSAKPMRSIGIQADASTNSLHKRRRAT